ncbi:restriction endonuclease subunit S [Pseudactinotalea sp. HY158]|uniref:restriction endonuclease subunit S n=1 Tax=Pseudactinotalea sp. HY158 TaxID=2654547 RepID=UPI00129C1A0B|nr:restriction endonuclease subunit S [Pseudactinotalea sp. HY158]QGH69320.1 hypothetical protein GCE65_07200 [Pseudactinotalea sp. HY158]
MRTAILGDVATINPRGEKVEDDAPVSFVGMAELDPITARARPLESRRFRDVSSGYTTFRDGDILAAKITPCWENVKIGQAQLDHAVGVGSTEFHVVRPLERLHDRYLLHFLRQSHVRATGALRMIGSGGQRRVPAIFLRELRIPLPPLPEQRRIAAILDHADALRAKRRQVLAHLDSLTQAIFHDMFSSVRDRIALGELAVWRSGGTPTRTRPEFFEGDIPWYSSGELGSMYVDDSKEHISAEALLMSSAKAIPAGAILLGMYDTAALNSSIATSPGACNQAVAFAIVDDGAALAEFVYFAVQAIRPQVNKRRRGVRQKNLNLSMIRQIEIPRASIDDQREFAARVEQLTEQRKVVEVAEECSDELFASLQSRAFRGEL